VSATRAPTPPGTRRDVQSGAVLVDGDPAEGSLPQLGGCGLGERRQDRGERSREALKRGLGVERAADILWTINHPDVWHLLVGQRGWSPKQYEQWSADTACSQLLEGYEK